MSQQQWLEHASGHLTEPQREALAQVKAALPADLDRAAAMERFQALNARIKAALPLDPAGEQAQRFLDERDAMLAPFLALFSPEAKAAARDLRATIRQGDLPPSIDADVDRFYRDATRARSESGKS